MTTVGIKLDDETQKRLRDLGAMKDRSPHWLMKEAITRYLDIEEQVERERREDQERYERFVATGEHIPHDQMMVWLDGLVGHKRAKTRSVAKRRVAKRRPRKPK